MRRFNVQIAFYVLLIFASGVVVGGFGTHLYTAKSVSAKQARFTPEEFRRAYTSEMQTHLNLTPDQMTKLNVILDETGAKVHTEHERHNQEMKAIHEDQVSQTRAILTDTQQPVYEKLRKEREDRAKADRARRDRGEK